MLEDTVETIFEINAFTHNCNTYFSRSAYAPARLTQIRQFQTALSPKQLDRLGCRIYR